MKLQYMAVYRLHGISGLCGDVETLELGRSADHVLKLTTNPEPFCFHIDRSAAIGTCLLTGLFAPEGKGTPEERLAALIGSISSDRQKKHGSGVFLICEGTGDIPSPDFNIRRDMGGFGICFDAFDKKAVCALFRPAVRSGLAAITLVLSEDADGRIDKVGDVSCLVEPGTEKPIYSFSFAMGLAKLSVAKPISADAIHRVRELLERLPRDGPLAKVVNLLIESQETTTNDLRAFIAAWSALEIFVAALFKATYCERWFSVMVKSAPASARSYFDRLKVVMSDKHRLTDKFLIIASVLNEGAAEQDTATFKHLKKVRDGLFHASEGARFHYPAEAVQKLVRKYLELHLAGKWEAV
jgi:hypothetical protein